MEAAGTSLRSADHLHQCGRRTAILVLLSTLNFFLDFATKRAQRQRILKCVKKQFQDVTYGEEDDDDLELAEKMEVDASLEYLASD